MYDWHLCFALLLESGAAAKTIADYPSRAHFTHSILTGPLSEEMLGRADVFFLDCGSMQHLERIAADKKEAAKIIYVARDTEPVPPDLYGRVQAVWRIDQAMIEFGTRLGEMLERYELERKAKLHFKWLETIIDASPDMIWIKDLKGAHLEVNDTFCQMVGKTKEQIRGRGHYFIWDISPDEYAKGEYVCVESDLDVIRQRQMRILWENVKIKDQMRKFRTWKAPIFDDDDGVMGTIGIAKDVTGVLNLTNELETILNCVPFAVMLTDGDNRARSVNSAFLDMLDCERGEIIGQTYDAIQKMMERKGWYYTDTFKREMSYTSESGSKWLGLSQRDVRDVFGNEVGRIVIYEDITEEKKHAVTLLREARTDPLTGLFNRRYFYEQIPLIRKSGRIKPGCMEGVVFIDVDKFKQLNDTYGHDEGDRALQGLAGLMRSEFAHCRALMARLGGDEFLIYFSNMTGEQMERLTSSFVAKVREQFSQSQTMKGLSCSAGLIFSGAQPDIDDFVKAADAAMYKAKQDGLGLCAAAYALSD